VTSLVEMGKLIQVKPVKTVLKMKKIVISSVEMGKLIQVKPVKTVLKMSKDASLFAEMES